MKTLVEFAHNVKVSKELSGSLLFRQLELFRGPVDPKALVSDFLEQESAVRQEDAGAEGAIEPVEHSEGIKPEVIEYVGDYLSSILRIGESICNMVSKEFTDRELKVVQVRTNFDFHTWVVKILFLIDADPRKELRFSQLLNQIEKVILLKERFMPELIFVNRRNTEIDCSSLRRDFPFAGKIRSTH